MNFLSFHRRFLLHYSMVSDYCSMFFSLQLLMNFHFEKISFAATVLMSQTHSFFLSLFFPHPDSIAPISTIVIPSTNTFFLFILILPFFAVISHYPASMKFSKNEHYLFLIKYNMFAFFINELYYQNETK